MLRHRLTLLSWRVSDWFFYVRIRLAGFLYKLAVRLDYLVTADAWNEGFHSGLESARMSAALIRQHQERMDQEEEDMWSEFEHMVDAGLVTD